MPDTIQFDRDALNDLRKLRRRDQTTILDHIRRYLRHRPEIAQGTRIKVLEQPAVSQFRLRVGEFRVYYDVDEVNRKVYILRVVRKGRRTTEEVIGNESD